MVHFEAKFKYIKELHETCGFILNCTFVMSLKYHHLFDSLNISISFSKNKKNLRCGGCGPGNLTSLGLILLRLKSPQICFETGSNENDSLENLEIPFILNIFVLLEFSYKLQRIYTVSNIEAQNLYEKNMYSVFYSHR